VLRTLFSTLHSCTTQKTNTPKKKTPKSEKKEEKRNGMAAWPAPTAIRARSTTTQIRHRDRPQLFNATRPPSLASQTQPTPAHHHRTQTPRQRRRSTEKTRGEGNAAESDTDGLAPRGLPPDPRTSRRPPPPPLWAWPSCRHHG
jgi:hypothetical protein